MTKTCPKCRLINPAEAEKCDCGWSFVAPAPPSQSRSSKDNAKKIGIIVGVVVFVLVLGGVSGAMMLGVAAPMGGLIAYGIARLVVRPKNVRG